MNCAQKFGRNVRKSSETDAVVLKCAEKFGRNRYVLRGRLKYVLYEMRGGSCCGACKKLGHPCCYSELCVKVRLNCAEKFGNPRIYSELCVKVRLNCAQKFGMAGQFFLNCAEKFGVMHRRGV